MSTYRVLGIVTGELIKLMSKTVVVDGRLLYV
jgi:hypothetical protein